MRSAWSDDDARAAVARYPGCPEDLALRVYTSRLIGAEPALVLHGGGNTSVKTDLPDDLGCPTRVALIKGSGWDLASIEPPGFPAVRLRPLLALRALESLDDEAMVNAVRTRMLDASAPTPSVEALLHAFLPHKFIDHSHADAVLSVVDQAEAAARARDVFGPDFAIVPYIMPGFALAKLAAEIYEQHPSCHGLVLLRHGLFTFGETARISYERHIAAVTRAEEHLAARRVQISVPAQTVDYAALAPTLRGLLPRGVLHWRRSPEALAFASDPRVRDLTRGPITPDHVIRTKQRPLVLDTTAPDDLRHALTAYRVAYTTYFEDQCRIKAVRKVMLDPNPRVLLINGLGLVTTGPDEKSAKIAADIYERTIAVIRDAEAIGQFEALPDGDIFDMEYWSLEQAKLGAAKTVKPLAGHVVYVTGAASGIGLATARRFAAAGAHLYLVDRDPGLAAVARSLGAAFELLDVTDRRAVESSIKNAVVRFGGVDGVVSNAGAAFQAPIARCPEDVLRASLELNLLSTSGSRRRRCGCSRRQGSGGFLLFNASKAAFNPGEGFGPTRWPRPRWSP
jgi:rhamnose utilization protein RhaD (predicted bifunctional aldolase and dehydrogenase)